MRVLIDILTPKQSMFFSKLSEYLEGKGHNVWLTTRDYREVNQILKLKGINAVTVGEHGGKELVNKLKASAQRILDFIPLLKDLNPDITISFSSPELARASYGLKIPHLCVNDSPHAEAVARLTLPLSRRLLTPEMIPLKYWTPYGISPSQIVQYNAIDPWVWLKDFKPNKEVVADLGLDESKPILTFRVAETFAAYLLGKTQKDEVSYSMINRLLTLKEDLQIVVLPRYVEQVKQLQRDLGNSVCIPLSVVDGPSLLYYSTVFVGAGGTMSAEAALLGVPTLSCYPGEPYVIEKFLIQKGLLKRELDPEKLLNSILRVIEHADEEKFKQEEIAKRLVSTFENPIEVISEEAEQLYESKRPY